MDTDERLIIFKIQVLQACKKEEMSLSDEKLFIDDLEKSLKDPDVAMQRREEKIIKLFGLKTADPDSRKNDPFAQKVLDVLFGS